MRLSALSAALISVGLVTWNTLPAQETAQGAEPASCRDLATLAIANTTISSADAVAAGAFEAPGPAGPGFAPDYSQLPAFCRVAGSIKPTPDSDIRFEVWLPAENWNGKFLQTGNGGAAGSRRGQWIAPPLNGHDNSVWQISLPLIASWVPVREQMCRTPGRHAG